MQLEPVPGLDLSDDDVARFQAGTYGEAYRYFGAHCVEVEGQVGVRFAVWAPRARAVRLIGDWNGWEPEGWEMEPVGGGIWRRFVPGLGEGTRYKFEVEGASGERVAKADPYAFSAEVRPQSASRVVRLGDYPWGDAAWMERRRAPYDGPLNVYEVHLGSWARGEGGRFLSYRELAERLIPYALDMGYTHLELLPVAEHPFDGSWGYQVTGFYAVTSRYGSPHDLMHFVDAAHRAGLGVILDWVPAHFCKDLHGLARFDGEPLYEPDDPRRAENHWGTLNFDFERPEVRSFLLSNALYWFRHFHVDGLRVDAVSQMLYRGYDEGENPAAVEFLQTLNREVFAGFPEALMIAEESSTWPGVTRPVSEGGLGFNFKWNMGWMNDVLRYMSLSYEARREQHTLLTFSLTYAFTENFILPLSHDEVVHGKRSLLGRMPGDEWQQFANLRLLLAYQIAHPGKKLLFMGGEFGQFIEWRYDESLEWHLTENHPLHAGMHRFVRALNRFYRDEPCLWEHDTSWDGFEWIDPDNREQSVLLFERKGRQGSLVVACNFWPAYDAEYRIGVSRPGTYEVAFHSDREEFGGTGKGGAFGLRVRSEAVPCHGRPYSLRVEMPPLAALFLRRLPAARMDAASRRSYR